MNDTMNSTADITKEELFARACPTKEDTPFFNHCMSLAKDMGMTWEEALRYTIEMRQNDR
jgi:hypothetical protein